MKPDRKKAVIAGAGVAGLSAAVYLDELGYQVTLVEKKPILGGRTYSFKDKKTGLTIDNGQHLMIGAYHETIHFLERIGAKHKIEIQIPTKIPLLDLNLLKLPFTLGRPPLHLARAFLQFKGLSFKDKLTLIPLARELKKIKKGKTLPPSDLTVNQWLRKFNQSEAAIKNFWEVLTLATLNDDPDTTTADGLTAVLIKSYFSGKNDGFLIFPKVGLSELFVEPAEKYLKMRGHHIIRGLALKEIRILNNKVQAFKFADGTEVQTDLFISALPFRQLLHTMPSTLIESRKDLNQLRTMQSSPIISINLFFDKPVMTDKFIGSASTTTHWFFCKNKIFAPSPPRSPAPSKNNITHIMGVISGAYDHLEKSKEEIVRLALNDLQKIYPNLKNSNLVHALVNKEREATLSCRVGINPIRPKQKILENFYIVGDWTKTDLPGTIESAIRSSKLMAEDLNIHAFSFVHKILN